MISPKLSNLDLAYEAGLHIDDGSPTGYPPHYRYVLSGNRAREYGFYRYMVVPLVGGLYDVRNFLYTEHSSVNATVYSKELVLFKAERIGLPIGPKDQLQHLPSSIIQEGRPSIASLLSGIFDADASPKMRRTPSGGYPRISFAQKVKGIVEDVHVLLLHKFRTTSTMHRNDYFDRRSGEIETRWFLDINGFENLAKFSTLIGSRHPNVQQKFLQPSLLKKQP